MKSNSSSLKSFFADFADFAPIIAGGLVFVAIILVAWIDFESSQSKNLTAVSNYKQQMIQVSGYTTGPWEYSDSSGANQKTRDCGTSDDFWKGRRCAQTEDGRVTFRYGTSKSTNIYNPVLIIDGREIKLDCVKVGSSFFEPRNHCGI